MPFLAVDPNAQVLIGGMAAANTSNSGDTLSIADFFARATAHEPLLAGLASATAVHIYPATDPLQQLDEDDYYPLDPSRS